LFEYKQFFVPFPQPPDKQTFFFCKNVFFKQKQLQETTVVDPQNKARQARMDDDHEAL
jgi:hypothetical protein